MASLSWLICLFCIAFVKECDALRIRYSYYRSYYYYSNYDTYYYYYYGSTTSVGLYVGIVLGIVAFLTLVFFVICCVCCRRRQNTTGMVLTNPSTQQTVITSNLSAGDQCPPTSNQNNIAQYNTAFQYGMGAPGQSFDNSSAPRNGEPAPSYESVVGQDGPIPSSYTMQESFPDTCSVPYKT